MSSFEIFVQFDGKIYIADATQKHEPECIGVPAIYIQVKVILISFSPDQPRPMSMLAQEQISSHSYM